MARGLAPTRSKAQALILAGDVRVNGAPVLRAGQLVAARDVIDLAARPRFVSRGGEKLDHALNCFDIDVEGLVAVDLGACTGGFTDCLLQRGAERVYSIDVGYGQIDDRLRQDARVVVMERTNARYLESLPELVQIAVIDVSFISLGLIFPVVAQLLESGGTCVPLIKPQFEAGRKEIGKGGVVRDTVVHRQVIERVIEQAELRDLHIAGLTASPLVGPAGNVEFLAYFVLGNSGDTEKLPKDVQGMIDVALFDAAAVVGSGTKG